MAEEAKTDPTTTPTAAQVEQLTARIAQLEDINRQLKEEKREVKTKAIKPDEIEKTLAGEKPSDSRLFKLYDELKEQRDRAEKAEADLATVTAERDDLSGKHKAASERLDRIDMAAAVKKAAPTAFVDDLFDVAVDQIAPHLGRDEKTGEYVPFKDGKPWVDDKGKPVTLDAVVADMAPNGDHKLTGINRPSLFRPSDTKEPQTFQTFPGQNFQPPTDGRPRSLDEVQKEIEAERH